MRLLGPEDAWCICNRCCADLFSTFECNTADTIQIYTSHGRSRIFGSYQEPAGRDSSRIRCINSSQDGNINAIFYNDLRSKDTELELRLAVSSTQSTTVEVPEFPPWPTSGAIPNICRQNGQTWYHSQAPSRGIRSIKIWKDCTTRICFGMELNYHDLSREVLGQWRGGSCIEELTVENNAKAIYFICHFSIAFLVYRISILSH